jgi:cytochrome b561
MKKINEVSLQKKNGFDKKISLPLSIWHWSNLVVLVCILITVLLVKTIFSGKENYPLIQAALEKKGAIISVDQAKVVAKLYTHKLWDWHVYFGYVLSGLFLFRLVLEYFQLTEERLFKIIKTTRLNLKTQKERLKESRHYLLVRLIYLLFYTDLALMVATGLFIEFSDNYPNLKPLRSFIKDIHNVGMYIMLAFIVSHLGGLLIHEINKNRHSSL